MSSSEETSSNSLKRSPDQNPNANDSTDTPPAKAVKLPSISALITHDDAPPLHSPDSYPPAPPPTALPSLLSAGLPPHSHSHNDLSISQLMSPPSPPAQQQQQLPIELRAQSLPSLDVLSELECRSLLQKIMEENPAALLIVRRTIEEHAPAAQSLHNTSNHNNNNNYNNEDTDTHTNPFRDSHLKVQDALQRQRSDGATGGDDVDAVYADIEAIQQDIINSLTASDSSSSSTNSRQYALDALRKIGKVLVELDGGVDSVNAGLIERYEADDTLSGRMKSVVDGMSGEERRYTWDTWMTEEGGSFRAGMEELVRRVEGRKMLGGLVGVVDSLKG